MSREAEAAGDRKKAPAEPGTDHAIDIHLDELLAARGMTLTELSEKVGVTIVNLSILKNGRARAIRFSTLTRLCEVLDCQPGDLLTWRKEPSSATADAERAP
jgi:putative transcriptional regulator